MMLITGPLYGGKRAYILDAMGLSEEELSRRAVWDVQERVDDVAPEALADALSSHDIVIITEVGGGVVPTDPRQRARREAAGRLACLLAARADTVIRVCCGLPQLLKGDWPCASF